MASKSLLELEVYKLAHLLGEKVWSIVITWKFLDRDTLGKQLIRSADSISLNISEGYGRYSYKENKQFCFYARGSLFETKEGLFKATDRKLISKDESDILLSEIIKLEIKLNNYIKSIGTNKS